jgi:hypothetical protein
MGGSRCGAVDDGFICDPPATFLPAIDRLLRPGGLLSIATCTHEAMASVHRKDFPRLSRWLGIQASQAEDAFTPVDHSAPLQYLHGNGFEIVA